MCCNISEWVLYSSFKVILIIKSFLERAIYWSIWQREGNQQTHQEEDLSSYLKRVVEVTNFAEVVQELVNSSFVVFNKRIEGHHICFLRVGGLICKILKHLGDLCGLLSINLRGRSRFHVPV